MKIVRMDLNGTVLKRSELHRLHVNHLILILQRSFHQQKPRAGDDDLIRFVHIGRDDDVGNARLVFHGEKNKSFGGAWTLAGDDASGGTHPLAIATDAPLSGGENELAAPSLAS